MKIAKHKTKEYHRERSAAHYRKYKKSYNARSKKQREEGKAFVLGIFKATGCTKCTEKEPAALDFHHTGKKDAPVSQMYAYNRKRLVKEISRCVVLCSNCHRKHHAGLLDL